MGVLDIRLYNDDINFSVGRRDSIYISKFNDKNDMKLALGLFLIFLFIPLAILPFGRKLLESIYDEFIYF